MDDAIKATLDPKYLSMTNVTWYQILNWSVTIIPIWFVGMTLYQRICCQLSQRSKESLDYCRSVEWPIMAFMGVILGMLAR
jgi:SSS family solute:Na+ symporter